MYDQQLIDQWKEEHDVVYAIDILDQNFVYRKLYRDEYSIILGMDLDDTGVENMICDTAVLWPENISFSEIEEGIGFRLSQEIMKASALMQGQADQMLQFFREDMQIRDSQVDCIIKEAFPEFDIEEIARWTIEKTMFYLSRAEYILIAIRGVPLNNIVPQLEEPQEAPPQRPMSPQERAERSALAQPEPTQEKKEPEKSNGRVELSEEELSKMLNTDLRKNTLNNFDNLPEMGWFRSGDALKGEYD